jgi:hypothetical protein
MKNFYKDVFWFFVAVFLILVGWSCFKKDISLIKDIGLPFGAMIFTVGNLWHMKENQEFEEKKHSLERKDKYWDKRFKFYSKLHELVGIINYKLMGEDVIPQKDGIDFKDTKLGWVYKTLQELDDEGEILFNNSNISLLIKKIREKTNDVIKNLQTMITNKQTAQQVGVSQNDALIISAFTKNVELNGEIEKITNDCRKEIFAYLK